LLSLYQMTNIFDLNDEHFINEHLDVLAIMGMNFNGNMFREGRLVCVGKLLYGSIFAEISALLGPTDIIGNAARKFINKTEVVRTENKYISFKNGAIDSVVGNPTRISLFEECITLEWVHRGIRRSFLHRDDGPAMVLYENYNLIKEEWRFEGYLHNLNGPARICYNPDGSVYLTEYYDHGQLHRIDGPAFVLVGDGTLTMEYRQRDQLHRTDGPAYIVTFEGSTREVWYINGEIIDEN